MSSSSFGSTESSPKLLPSRLDNLEMEVRETARADAIRWRKRSCIKWLSIGEAPTRYFFAQYKAKQSRETLRNIRIDEHTYFESDESDRQQVHKFYNELFKRDDADDQNRVERVAILRLITKRLTQVQNLLLTKILDDREIDEVVCSFQKKKSLGIDGINTKCFTFARPLCKLIV